jgi:shikimate kinase
MENDHQQLSGDLTALKARIKGHMTRPVVLVGMMAAGKTHLGRLLAETLDVPFIDTDLMVEEKAGKSIAAIFAQDGEPAFRALEAATIAAILGNTPKPAIVATGGGAILNPASADLIFSAAITVWVRATPGTIIKRTAHRNDRPLLKNGNPQKILEDLAAVRDPIYTRANIVIDTDDTTPRWALHAVLKEIDRCLP